MFAGGTFRSSTPSLICSYAAFIMFYVVRTQCNICLRVFYDTVVCIGRGLEKGTSPDQCKLQCLLLEETAQGVGEICIPEYVVLL